jgi:hypothetical protein
VYPFATVAPSQIAPLLLLPSAPSDFVASVASFWITSFSFCGLAPATVCVLRPFSKTMKVGYLLFLGG